MPLVCEKPINILDLNDDILNKIGYYVLLDKQIFEKKNHKLEEKCIDFFDTNGIHRLYKIRADDEDLWHSLVDIIDDIKEIDRKKVYEYYFEEMMLDKIISKIREEKIEAQFT